MCNTPSKKKILKKGSLISNGTYYFYINICVMEEIVLELKDASIFQKESLVLSEVTIKIAKGEFVYLIGKTGSGKSSFMKTLYGDLPLQKGEGHVVDFDLKTLKEKDIPFLRRKLGIVFQDFKLLPDRNINQNMAFVLKATGWTDKIKMDTQVSNVLEKVGMKTKGFKFPHELSGGEQQRIAIARALLNDPELIIADEPTGNLDPQTSVEVMKVLQEINKSGRTILMATHDYALILKFPSKTIKCDANKVFEVVQRAV
ncbi:cell division transport system ATP-binding protein [Maribacter caenipelagi]|uniref:Cell division ATP-binding protein FtsE n=2 Tax=Maribacter caenipelagi TaxID=1447781 RepID=A0A4R7DC67_9FLAO|nr:cell division transport system ATP-binding protein [Maribacter caenipelagi]